MHNKENKHISPHKIDKQLLEKYYNKSCTPKEKKVIEEWFVNVHNVKEVEQLTKQFWEDSSSTGKEKEFLNNLLFKIHNKIIIEKQQKEKRSISLITGISAAITIGIIFLTIGLWVGTRINTNTKEMYSKLYAPYGSRVRFELPDGSKVWLNSGSTLKYPIRFAGKSRKIFLNGEAYFDVKHNPDKPFIVNTKNIRVTALGTSFNVHAYSNANINDVTLVKGAVVVDKKAQNNTYKKELVMKPGQHISLNTQTGRLTSSNKDTEKYTAWKDGILMFRNDPLSRVINEMELYYNVNIEVSDPALYKYHFHATFEDETLFETLRLLKISSGINYKICKRKKKKDGTFKKRRIILYANKS